MAGERLALGVRKGLARTQLLSQLEGGSWQQWTLPSDSQKGPGQAGGWRGACYRSNDIMKVNSGQFSSKNDTIQVGIQYETIHQRITESLLELV